jgi:hypothetical protein
VEKKVSENQALIDICLNCEKPTCSGWRECKRYVEEKKKLAAEAKKTPPAASIEPVNWPKIDEKKMLQTCNMAIDALMLLKSHDSENMELPHTEIYNCLIALTKARVQAYAHLVDWDMIAKKITEEEPWEEKNDAKKSAGRGKKC